MKTGKILIVEDDGGMREELAELLKLEGMEVVTTRLGLEGKNLLDKGDFSLVLLDLKLPDIDGTELLRHIKANSTALVVIVTGKPLQGNLEQDTLNEGSTDMAAIDLADGVIEKPFRIERLIDTIRRLIFEKDHPIT